MKILSLGVVVLLVLGVIVNGCKKEEDTLSPSEQFALDIMIIEEYIADNNLQMEKTSSGLYYSITEEGTGDHPVPGDTVTVKYKGYLTDGTVFDQTSPANVLTWPLNDFIQGWVEGIPLLKSGGGKGKFIIPSQLGYGPNPNGGIPANSVLIFDVTLIDINQ